MLDRWDAKPEPVADGDRPGLLLSSTVAPHVLALHPALTSTRQEIFEMADLLRSALEEAAHVV